MNQCFLEPKPHLTIIQRKVLPKGSECLYLAYLLVHTHTHDKVGDLNSNTSVDTWANNYGILKGIIAEVNDCE